MYEPGNLDNIKCSRCGTSNNRKWLFCVNCQNKLTDKQASENTSRFENEKINNLTTDALVNFMTGDYNSGIAKMNEALELDSANYGLICTKAAYQNMFGKDFLGTLKTIEYGLGIYPDDDWLLQVKINMLIELQKYSEAYLELSKIFNNAPPGQPIMEPQKYKQMALILTYLKRYTESVDFSLKAIEMAPSDYEAYFALSIIYSRMDRLDEAHRYICKALELNQDSFDLKQSKENLEKKIQKKNKKWSFFR
jgi:tetratricopeptide (TPR) repeat protein